MSSPSDEASHVMTGQSAATSPTLGSFSASSISGIESSSSPIRSPASSQPLEPSRTRQRSTAPSPETPAFFNPNKYISQSPQQQTWDIQCECGGISPHYHGQPRDRMNGAHIPTGPRGESGAGAVTGSNAPTSPQTPSASSAPKRIGPLPNFVQVARAYVFEQEIQKCLRENGVSQAREDNLRLAGVQWIDNTRRALKLPVRTFNTAVVYYHKFRLQHSDGEYSFVDAAAAALFAACKIEDTLKKSRDILCAAHNLKAPRTEQLSPDDQIFEHHSRTIIGLERLMLEASGFDFRNRHPQDFLIKLLKHYSYAKTSPVVKTAYTISLDLYRTWAPLKQTTATMAFACLELAGRLLGEENEVVLTGRDYKAWKVERGMVMETLLDLLELYTHHRGQTMIGPEFPVDTFLEVRIPLNLESEERKIPRYTAWVDNAGGGPAANGSHGNNANVNGTSAGVNGSKSKNVSPRDIASPRRVSTNTNASSGGAGNAGAAGSGAVAVIRQRVGERGREGTVRFILNPDREREEKAMVDLFSKP